VKNAQGPKLSSKNESRPRLFLLSPANCGGARAKMIASPRAGFDLALRLRGEGAPLGEVFSFVSGLYFRGKLAYARRFSQPPDPGCEVAGNGVLVITPNAGLRTADAPVTLASFESFASQSIDAGNPLYLEPLVRSARALNAVTGPDCEVVLLGSIASGKYVDVLLPIFGDRLLFPSEFVGRGDMSRGGLLLRRVLAGEELAYVPVQGAVRRGQRPPKLAPLPPQTIQTTKDPKTTKAW